MRRSGLPGPSHIEGDFEIADGDVRCGVAICEMVANAASGEPIASGVVFMADPLDGRRDVFIIETTSGIGDKLVRGDVTPLRARAELRSDGLGPVEGETGPLPRPWTEHLLRQALQSSGRFRTATFLRISNGRTTGKA